MKSGKPHINWESKLSMFDVQGKPPFFYQLRNKIYKKYIMVPLYQDKGFSADELCPHKL